VKVVHHSRPDARVLHTAVSGSDVVGTDAQMQYLVLSMLSCALAGYEPHADAV